MAVRNRWKNGDWLMVDQISGVIYYASEVVTDWDGTYRLATDIDGKHPDLIRKPIIKERYPDRVSPTDTAPVPSNTLPQFIGGTTVRRPVSPADGLFL